MAQPATNPKIEELRFRLKTDPRSRLFYQLAEELRRAGHFAEAEQVLRSGLNVYPAYLAAWVSLGRALRELKNETGAVEALSKAMQLDPGNVVAARLLADAHLSLGDTVEALKKYKLVHALLPGDEELKNTIERLDREVNPPEPEPPPVLPSGGDSVLPSGEDSVLPSGEAPVLPSGEAPVLLSRGAPVILSREDGEGPPSDGAVSVLATGPFAVSAAQDDRRSAAQEDTTLPEPLQDSPFDKTTPPFEESTGDAEPMLAAHDESPFEEPAEGATVAAFDIEQPGGMHIETPLEEEADVFAPVVAEAPPAEPTNTLTMAELYERQGLVHEAQHIYENILARDPENGDARAKLDAVAPRVNPKIERLERWLSKVTRKEADGV